MSSKPSTPSSQRRKLHRSSGIFGLLPQSPKIHYPIDPNNLPLDSSMNTESFAQLSDCMEELEENMNNLQQIHDSITNGFNESFAGFLYGLLMTMWCVDFPGLPSKTDFDRISYSTQLDDEINQLTHQIQSLQQQNDSLKTTLQNKSKLANRRVLKPKSIINKPKNPKSVSKIPQPTRTNRPLTGTQSSQPGKSSTIATTPSRTSTTKSGSNHPVGPNLNQPPRYLQGLFNNPKTPTNANRRIQKPTSIHNRPPFR